MHYTRTVRVTTLVSALVAVCIALCACTSTASQSVAVASSQSVDQTTAATASVTAALDTSVVTTSEPLADCDLAQSCTPVPTPSPTPTTFPTREACDLSLALAGDDLPQDCVPPATGVVCGVQFQDAGRAWITLPYLTIRVDGSDDVAKIAEILNASEITVSYRETTDVYVAADGIAYTFPVNEFIDYAVVDRGIHMDYLGTCPHGK